MDITIGQVIKKYRKHKGMTQAELGKCIGEYPNTKDVSFTSISRWETGTRVPNIDFAVKIAEVLGIDTIYFIGLVVTEGSWSTFPTDKKVQDEIYKFFQKKLNDFDGGDGETRSTGKTG